MNPIDIVFALDCSLSMFSNNTDYLFAINNLLNTQREWNSNSLFTLVTFNNSVRTIYDNVPITSVKPITTREFDLQGTTRLFDGLGTAIKSKMMSGGGRKCPVLVILLTDGIENTSSVFTMQSIRSKVEELKKVGWNFLYLGTMEQSISMGRELGMEQCIQFNCTPKSIGKALEMVNVYISHLLYNYYGYTTPYTAQPVIDDVRELIEVIEGIDKMDIGMDTGENDEKVEDEVEMK